MPSVDKIRIRDVEALKPGEEIAEKSGLRCRRQYGEPVYNVVYRNSEGRQRRYTIGRHGAPWTPDLARNVARQVLIDIRVHGLDPSADKKAKHNAPTVAELCDLYLGDAQAGRLLTRRRNPKKATTLEGDVWRINRHVKPLLGSMKVRAVTTADVDRFMHDVAQGKSAQGVKTGRARVRGGKGTATRTVGLLGAIFSYAVSRHMRADNPAKGVVRYADNKRERRLSDDEYAGLGATLRTAEASIWPPAVAAVRFLALSGWRSGEAVELRRKDVDFQRRTAVLGDTKTGRSIRPLATAACDVIRSVKVEGERAFPAAISEGGAIRGFSRLWARIAKLGELPADITPHVLRHSFASLASDLGYSEPTIAALIGHKGHTTTSRYTHAADSVLLAAADAVANRTLELMGERKSGVVVAMPGMKQ
jgi:integrase